MSKIEVFTGPMCSGKSAALVNKIEKYKIAGKNILLIKPKKDTRDKKSVKSRDGRSYSDEENIYQISSIKEFSNIYEKHYKKVLKYSKEGIHLIQFDETHLYDDPSDVYDEFIIILINMAAAGIDIDIAGLDMSQSGNAFELMGKVMCAADKVHKFTAICSVTKEDTATMTKMNIDCDDDRVVGGDDIYSPVSREVWVKERSLKRSFK